MENQQFHTLLNAIENKEAVLGVVGLGYVGLPLAVEMVNQGFTVIGIDLDASKVESIYQGDSYIHDISSDELKKVMQSGRFQPTTDYSMLRVIDALSICVPTPLSENQDPDTSYIETVVDQIKLHMKPGMLITLESTTYPGTTEELIQQQLDKIGQEAGKDYFLCFSPERVDPSNGRFTTFNTPKVIGGTTEACLKLGTALYGKYVETVVPVSSPKVAEMSKLLENTFRSVNIAFVNEMAMMCDRMGIDIWEVIDAAATKPFGFMPFYPGPGIGGHCIPLDPMYLSWKAKGFRFYSKFIELAQSTNDNMPYYVLNKTSTILNEYAKSVRKSNILLLGMSYKPNIADLRESPGLEVYELFKESGANVSYYDPHADSFQDKHGETVHSEAFNLEQFKKYDCIVLITNHSDLPYFDIAEMGVPILDTRNAFRSYTHPHIYKIGHSVQHPVLEPSEALLV
ncbi:nucleotide sugar dehydrogenase [Paenibacillus sp. FSL H7-0942]|uniref:nucleotide sugar dehydrogenase n=1 Tax=Paenibacillus TaxID=44249 RepID=UPI0003E1DDF9|nr:MULTISPECIES: nucleotide sugar dehydrogenase [Paenibacillus]ETT29480.1 nucleotide sugar dehydrogenase [Paenibacillus sp. FSL R5-192]MCW3791107.1 nucleotide sugar dehydrogenase [Paenibacillus sp. LS1]OMF06319.1 UDP-N-acetyl-D-glucosamine dehydrogenase [Paenibacillus amylolyticus]OMF45291.1 UDP-N-acetyl-D-glucosamine dehydrogenase [Paenibacillus amylolyticus]WFA86013.1 nucleotide sugar dehydrogenase [Paenibacillus amylolyticus]